MEQFFTWCLFALKDARVEFLFLFAQLVKHYKNLFLALKFFFYSNSCNHYLTVERSSLPRLDNPITIKSEYTERLVYTLDFIGSSDSWSHVAMGRMVTDVNQNPT